MDLKNKTLEAWLKESWENKIDKSYFPGYGEYDYNSRYKTIKNYLNKNIHKHVTAYASIKDGGYLTDHGPDHIKTVIRRASGLVNSQDFDLSPYETYLLLVAIHFHDIGHIKEGRTQHAVNAKGVMMDLGSSAGPDNAEKRLICDIAQAHGGDIDGDKDKISRLQSKVSLLNFPIRAQLLAAILRFADELADDRERAAKYLMQKDKIPKSSEIYHYYAYSLQSVNIDLEGKSIGLSFELQEKDINRKYGKQNEKVYLLDEIYERTLKTHYECLYCMRFVPLEIQIKSIKVRIEFIDENLEPIREPINYVLKERGYPDLGTKDIFYFCPVDLKEDGQKLTGCNLKKLLKSRKKTGGKNVR